jgi:Fe-S cluster biogenesis protein NfuA
MDNSAVEAALNKVRPTLIADGGNVELVDIKDGVVQVRLTGACSTCPMAPLTLKMGVEKAIKSEFPEVKEVVAAYDYQALGC